LKRGEGRGESAIVEVGRSEEKEKKKRRLLAVAQP